MNDYEQDYEEFWKAILEPNGVLDVDLVKRELYDYHVAMKEVSTAYCEVTGGRFSKLNTKSCHIIDAVEESVSRSYDDGRKDEGKRTDIQTRNLAMLLRGVISSLKSHGLKSDAMLMAEAYLKREGL